MASSPSSDCRTAMSEVFRELREDSAKNTIGAESGIWETIGQVPGGWPFRRFGSPSDRWVFRLLRCVAIIDAVWVPFLLSFGRMADVYEGLAGNSQTLALEACSCSLYVMGVFQRLTTSTIDLATGNEYVEFRAIMTRQMWLPSFWMDVASLPGSFWWCGYGCRRLAALQLLRLWRLPSSVSRTYDITQGHNDRWEGLMVGELLASVWLVCHIFACICFSALTWSDADLQEVASRTPLGKFSEMQALYLRCLRDGVAMLVGWNGPSSSLEAGDAGASEQDASHAVAASLFWIIAGPCGSLFMAMIFALLLVAVDRAGQEHSKYMERMDKIGALLGSLSVPSALKRRIMRCHAFLSVHNIDRAAYEVVFSGLSSNLVVELKLHLFENLVMTAPFFQDVPPPAVMQMVTAFEEEVFSPGEIVVRKGAFGTEMFFIIKGSCEVLVDDEAKLLVAVKHVGDFFGEVALVFDHQPRTAWIRARTFCVLAKLTRAALERSLQNSPEVQKTMLRQIVEQYKELVSERHNALASSDGGDARDDSRFPLLDDDQGNSPDVTLCRSHLALGPDKHPNSRKSTLSKSLSFKDVDQSRSDGTEDLEASVELLRGEMRALRVDMKAQLLLLGRDLSDALSHKGTSA